MRVGRSDGRALQTAMSRRREAPGWTVVGRGGVEPPTFRFSGGRSYRLSYLPQYDSAVLTGLEPATSALTGRRALQLLHRTWAGTAAGCAPNGIRTRATALKGRRPGPLDDGGGPAIIAHAQRGRLKPHPAPPEAWKAYVMLGAASKPVPTTPLTWAFVSVPAGWRPG